jgi:hypothetical protein
MAPECSYLEAVVIIVMVVEMVHKIEITNQTLKLVEMAVITPTNQILATMLGRTLRETSSQRMIQITKHLLLTPMKMHQNYM